MEASSDLMFFVYPVFTITSPCYPFILPYEETLGCRCTRLYLDTSDADDSFITFFFPPSSSLQRLVLMCCLLAGLLLLFHIMATFLFAVQDSLSALFLHILVLCYIYTVATAEPPQAEEKLTFL